MITPPISPPEPVQGVSGPTYVACDSHVWRRSMQGWDIVPPGVRERLLAAFQADAMNTEDWWHKRAAELADELQTAITEADAQEIAA